MSKKIAILQSNYIPWKGYFDLMNQVDEFILYDDMQYTKNDWRNRNMIKSVNGTQWLSIPVKSKGKGLQKIAEAEIAKSNWGRKHWQTLIANYSKTPYFNEYREQFEDLYLDCDEIYLSQINYRFLTLINKILGIKTTLLWSSDFNLVGDKTERLVSLCQDTQANEYISGPAAKSYMNEEIFAEANIKINWMDYSDYPEYHQMGSAFEHGVSIIDLIFNEGKGASRYMKSFNHSVEQ